MLPGLYGLLELLAVAGFPAARLGPPAAAAGDDDIATAVDPMRAITAVAAITLSRLCLVRIAFRASLGTTADGNAAAAQWGWGHVPCGRQVGRNLNISNPTGVRNTSTKVRKNADNQPQRARSGESARGVEDGVNPWCPLRRFSFVVK